MHYGLGLVQKLRGGFTTLPLGGIEYRCTILVHLCVGTPYWTCHYIQLTHLRPNQPQETLNYIVTSFSKVFIQVLQTRVTDNKC